MSEHELPNIEWISKGVVCQLSVMVVAIEVRCTRWLLHRRLWSDSPPQCPWVESHRFPTDDPNAICFLPEHAKWMVWIFHYQRFSLLEYPSEPCLDSEWLLRVEQNELDTSLPQPAVPSKNQPKFSSPNEWLPLLPVLNGMIGRTFFFLLFWLWRRLEYCWDDKLKEAKEWSNKPMTF